MAEHLFQLVRANDPPALLEYLRTIPRADVDIKNDAGQSPLYWACELPTTDMAQILVSHGANVNAAELYGFTPLHLAAFIGNEIVVNFLLKHNADCNKRNNTGSTPLHLACKSGNASIVSTLLRHGALSDIRDDKGNLARDYAKAAEIQALFTAVPQRAEVAPATPTPASASSAASSSAPAAAAPAATPTSAPAAASASASASAGGSRRTAASRSEKVEQLKKTIENAKDPAVLRKIAHVLQQTLLNEESKNETLREKVQEEAAQRNCKQCQVAKRNALLLPCAHLLYCFECVSAAEHCPTCSALVAGVVQVKMQ